MEQYLSAYQLWQLQKYGNITGTDIVNEEEEQAKSTAETNYEFLLENPEI